MIKKTIVLLSTFALSISIYTGEAQAKTVFKDVPVNHWASEEIYSIEEKGIISGYEDRTFKPEKTITRSQIAIMVGRSINLPNAPISKSHFKDVQSEMPYATYVNALADKGVFVRTDKFNPHDNITKSQLAKILVTAFQLEGNTQLDMKGVSKTQWYYPYISILMDNGITMKDFKPNEKVTRAEMSVLLQQILQKNNTYENGEPVSKATHPNISLVEGTYGTLLPAPDSFYKFALPFVNQEKVNVTYQIRTVADIHRSLESIYTDLPHSATLKNNGSLSDEQIESTISEWVQKTKPQENINVYTLANYKLQKSNLTYKLIDNTHKELSASQIEKGLDTFSSFFAETLEGLSEEEKVNIIYNYIFDNFSYNASGFQKMLVGNTYNGEFACNGYAHLFYKLAKASQLNVEIIRGEEHFWNKVVLSNGETVTVDITTDDYLKERYASIGSSSENHISITNRVGFYNAKFEQAYYPYLLEVSKDTLIKLTKESETKKGDIK